ncbi:hypothetical protein AWB71_03886 [Caballeronia peredens]|nr:hypothetical protein AWB71_03886 [Caballeronia peredens]
MTTRLTFPASMFSVVCQRCGSTMRKNADSCPNCGADRNAAHGAKRDAAATEPRNTMFEQATSASGSAASMGTGERAEPSMRPSWAGWDAKRASERIAQKAAEYRARRAEAHARDAYADSSNDPDALPGSERWTRKKTIVASACGLALLVGATVYLQFGDSDSENTPSADHSVSGAIDSKIGPLVRGAVEAPAAPATDRRSQADTRTLAPGDALHGVRVALDQHDLGAARARLKALSAQQQARAEYEPLKDELVRRELQRDAALQLARACERTSAWACVQQNAGEALTLDGSNVESQAMLERVISHAGWLAPTASAALAKKVPPTAPATAATAPATTAPSRNVAQAPAATPAAPAQANVAAAAPPAKQNAIAQKPYVEKRASQRAAARQAAEEARAEAASESRAEKIARAQAATNAITATTTAPPVAPTVATTMTPRAAPSPSQVPSPTQPQATAKANPAPATQATATRAPQAQSQPQTQPQPHYIGEEESQPAATASTRTANPRAPQYIGDEPAQAAAPAARTGNPRSPYYLGEDPPQTAAPVARPAVPRPPQSTSQGNAQPPAVTSPQAAVPRPPAASAQPVAAQTAAAPRVSTTINQPAMQPTVSARAAQSSTGTGASPSSQFGSVPAGSHLDSDKTEELERAIKQYGWSGSEAAPKPSQ